MINNHPKVTIVICTYNQQDFIHETLDSVLGQTYPHLEVIITDDGSTDTTPTILLDYGQRYPDKVHVVLSEQNTGIPANINRGLALCTGELIVILDGDDLMLPVKIEKQVTFLQDHPEATGCYHDAEVFDSATGQTWGLMSQAYTGTTNLKQGKIQDWFVPRNFFLPSAIMFLASACPAHGYDERLKYLSEVVFFAEVFRAGTLLAMPEALVRYRRHTQNITSDRQARNLMPEYELIAYAILEARYPELHRPLRKLRHSCRLAQAIRYYREGNQRTARIIIGNVFREGAILQALAVWIGLTLFKQRITHLTGGTTQTRPSWIKRLARFVLRG